MVARWVVLYTALALTCPTGGLAHAPAELEQWGRTRAKARYARHGNSSTGGGQRQLAFVDWRPIRIAVHTAELQQDIPSASDFSYLVDDLLGAATRWLALALKVTPVMGTLQLEQHCASTRVRDGVCVRVSSDFQSCGDSTIPRSHFNDLEYCPSGQACQTSSGGDGVEDADYSLYVRAHDDSVCSFGSTLAYASSCHQDENDRPVAGFITFCKTATLGHKDWDMDVSTVVHEILHALGFSQNSYAFYRDDEGAPRTARDRWGFPPYNNGAYQAASSTILEVTQSDGSLKHYVTLPRVVKAAQEHYGCSTMDKLALEEQGGDGTSMSHWESRFMHTEVMAAVISDVARISPMTLALLEDSGWYRTDHSLSGAFRFGKDAGCDFLTEQCVKDGETEWPDIFCTNTAVNSCDSNYISGDIGCTHDLLGKAYCDACLHNADLDTNFQYFDNPRLGGSRAYLSYCPLWLTYSTSSFCSEPIAGDKVRTGEAYGPNSRCISSSGVQPGWSALARPEGSCRNVQCGFQSVTISFGSRQVVCRASDEGKSISIGGGWGGDVTCPSYAKICGDVDDRHGPDGVTCYFPGVLRDGRCVCSPGYIDEDCSKEDTSSVRAQYPFGLQYPQQELVLEATLPLSSAAGLIAWPFGPTLVNEVPQLSYSVSPGLPEGLTLSSTTGVLAGTPTKAVDKAAYTFRVAGGLGASTTTLFITVLCQATEPDCEVSAPSEDSVDTPSNGDTTAGSERCIDGLLLPAACVDTFTFQGTTYTGCTTVSSQTPWCSHDAVYDGSWSPCEVCSTTSQTPLPEGDPTSLVVVMATKFSAIQASPGLEPFMEQFASTVLQAIGMGTSVQSMSAMNASTALEFCLPDHCIDPDSVALGLFRTQLADSKSSLRTSEFGQAYLQSTTLMKMSGTGTVIVWPKPKTDSDSGADDDETAWWDLGLGVDIATLVIGGVLFAFAALSLFFCLGCFHRWLNKVWLRLQNAKRRRSRHSRQANPSPQVLGQPSPTSPPWIPAEPSPVAPQVQTPMRMSKDDCVTRMLEMGFEFQAALTALEATGWNVSRAATFLGGGLDGGRVV